MPNLTVSNITWTRVCPTAIDLQFTIARDDGLAIAGFPDDPVNPERDSRVTWTIGGPQPQSLRSDWVAKGARSYTYTGRYDPVPPGDYEIQANLDVYDRNISPNMNFGPCGVGTGYGSFTVDNAMPVLTLGAGITGASSTAVYVTMTGSVTDECPAYCRTTVSAFIVGVDDNDLEIGARFDLGTRQWPSASYTMGWALTQSDFDWLANNPDITAAKVQFTGITTDQWGLQGWPKTAGVRIHKPANKNFLGNE